MVGAIEPLARPPAFGSTRSVLFAPGNHSRRVEKALQSDADAVVLDLEDAVPDAEKARARELVAEALTNRPQGPRAYVRINGLESVHWEADLDAAVRARPNGVVLPKAEHAHQLHRLDGYLRAAERHVGIEPGMLELMPIIESAQGLAECSAILQASARVRRAIFGAADYSLDLLLDWTADEEALAFARATLVQASRLAGIEPPIDTAILQVRDLERFRRSANNGRRLGMQGKLCLHPDHIAPCHEVFAPSSAEIERARAVLVAFAEAQTRGSAATTLNGEFIDLPVALRARRLLARVECGTRADSNIEDREHSERSRST